MFHSVLIFVISFILVDIIVEKIWVLSEFNWRVKTTTEGFSSRTKYNKTLLAFQKKNKKADL